MKHWGCIVFIVGVFLTTFTAGSVLASDDTEALIDLLMKKGIIMQEEATQLFSNTEALIKLLVFLTPGILGGRSFASEVRWVWFIQRQITMIPPSGRIAARQRIIWIASISRHRPITG